MPNTPKTLKTILAIPIIIKLKCYQKLDQEIIFIGLQKMVMTILLSTKFLKHYVKKVIKNLINQVKKTSR